MLKSNYPTIDAARFVMHLFQMTVSPTHSVNLAGLNAAMMSLGLIGTPAGPQPCRLYFVVPPDVFPVYQHKPGSMVPAGSALPANVQLMVLEIPLDLSRQPAQAAAAGGGSAASASAASSVAAAAAGAGAGAAGSKRKAEDADSLLPPSSKKSSDAKCGCSTGCRSGRCKCFSAKPTMKCGKACTCTGCHNS